MQRPNAWWGLIAAAILGLGLSGCGKTAPKEEATTEKTDSESPEAPVGKEAPAAPQVAAAAPVTPVVPKTGAGDELLAMGAAPPAAQAPSSPPAAPPTAPPAAQAPAQGQAQMGVVGPNKGRNAGATNPATAETPGQGGPNAGMMGGSYPRPGGGGSTQNMGAMMAPGAMGGGAAGPGGPGGPGGPDGAAMRGGPGGGDGGGTLAKSDFSTESKGAESFLSALKSRDAKAVAEALALHSRYEASGAHKGDFGDILDETASAEQINKIASEFDGFQIQSLGQRLGEGEVKVILTKQDEKSSMSRTLTMRHEKLGWKVQDYGGKREIKRPQMMGAARKKSR